MEGPFLENPVVQTITNNSNSALRLYRTMECGVILKREAPGTTPSLACCTLSVRIIIILTTTTTHTLLNTTKC